MTQHLNEIWCVARDLESMSGAFQVVGNDHMANALARMADRLDEARTSITLDGRLDIERRPSGVARMEVAV